MRSPVCPDSPVAQGSLFVLLGTNMGPARLQGAPSFPLQTTLAGTSISITVDGSATQGIMLYSMSAQVAAVLPSTTQVRIRTRATPTWWLRRWQVWGRHRFLPARFCREVTARPFSGY